MVLDGRDDEGLAAGELAQADGPPRLVAECAIEGDLGAWLRIDPGDAERVEGLVPGLDVARAEGQCGAGCEGETARRHGLAVSASGQPLSACSAIARSMGIRAPPFWRSAQP